MNKILAIVPSRGGSKSIPRKNIKMLAGKPLIAYTLQEAARSHWINRIIVSTEDKEIAKTARDFGAEVPFLRPSELALDHVTDLPVFQHCLSWLKEKEGYQPEIVVHLRPTAPLRRFIHIDKGIELLLKSPDADSVRSICPVDQHPLKMWTIKNNWIFPFIPEKIYNIKEAYNQPRQQLPCSFVQNGSVDVIRANVILKMNSMTGRRIKAFIMEKKDSVNIDSPLDWVMAEILIKNRQNNLDILP